MNFSFPSVPYCIVPCANSLRLVAIAHWTRILSGSPTAKTHACRGHEQTSSNRLGMPVSPGHSFGSLLFRDAVHGTEYTWQQYGCTASWLTRVQPRQVLRSFRPKTRSTFRQIQHTLSGPVLEGAAIETEASSTSLIALFISATCEDMHDVSVNWT